MSNFKKYRTAFIVAFLFTFLMFPIVTFRVGIGAKTVIWRWKNPLYLFVIMFIGSILWQFLHALKTKEISLEKRSFLPKNDALKKASSHPFTFAFLKIGGSVFLLIFPFITSLYQVNIVTTALMYIVLGLGLNITVGLGGLLNLGYAAFFAFGAYTYALLNLHFGIGFWLALPIGALVGAFFGFLVGLPTLRLQGDYLAIVTLAFGSIATIVLTNWSSLTSGPKGIAGIPKPTFFDFELGLRGTAIYLYFILLFFVLISVIVTRRLEDSRLGRSWEAMQDDQIASQSVGINIAYAKLTSITISSFFAGLMGVVFAAKTSFVNPASFTIWESIVVLCIIIIGGKGSIPGVIIGALIFILLPEYFRPLAKYRILGFGLALVLMMIFRPEGILKRKRRHYHFQKIGGTGDEISS